ncbi:MAG: pyridoxamine 5'-phosphate oxidase [Acidimicrobiia bacterium]
MDLDALRREYESNPLDVEDLAADPIVQIQRWLDEWVASTPHEPSAIVLVTADGQGRPSARNVLLRRLDGAGLTFFTSYRSRKAQDLAANPHATILFSWVPVLRQIHVAGSVHRVPAAESDAYWATRPRGSQLAAWASEQSSVLPDRAALEARFAEMEERYKGGEVPRPPHWGGYRLVPETVELWQGRANRMHDRLRYQRVPGRDGWDVVRLAP